MSRRADDRVPPGLAERLLRRCLRRDGASLSIIGDLREEFAAVVHQRSRFTASLWYWRQTVTVGLPYLAARLRRGSRRQQTETSGFFDALGRDWRSARRVVTTAPMFTLAVAGTLALGIGANTLVFSLVNGILISPLPYPDAERLVSVSEGYGNEMPVGWASVPNYVDWRAESSAFESLGLFRGRSMSLTVDGVAEYIFGVWVTAEFFESFGTPPLLGRVIDPSENGPAGAPVAVLSYQAWRDRYGLDQGIIGRSVQVDGTSRTIVGVMPPGFNAPARWIGSGVEVDLWIPFALDPGSPSQARENRSYSVVGRLRPGIPLQDAVAEFNLLAARLRAVYPDANGGWFVHLVAWHELIVGRVRSVLVLLWGAVAGVLLIACANVVNLQLNRITSRRAELAVRSALGASRAQLVRLVLAESVMTALLGAVFGCLLAVGCLRVLRAVNPGNIPRLDEVGIGLTTLGATLGGAVVIGLGIGLASALRIVRDGAVGSLTTAAARAGRSVTGRERIHNVIAVTQLAGSIPLLVGAGLLGRSFLHLVNERSGLQASGVLTATVVLSWNRVPAMSDRIAFVHDALARIESIPGVMSVGMINSLPFSGSNAQMPIVIEGRREARPGEALTPAFRGVSPGYFGTMGIPIIAGRDFDAEDLRVPSTVLINATMARQLWLQGDAVGRQFSIEGETEPLTVIGVVGDVKHFGLDAAVRMEVYRPYTADYLSSKTFVARTSGDPASLVGSLRTALRSIDSEQPIRDVTPMDEYVSRSLSGSRFNVTMIVLFSAVAVTLAMVGLFSVVAYSVTQRTHELQIRMALGAKRGEVITLVVRRGAFLAAIGAAVGLVASAGAATLLRRFLYGVEPGDVVTYICVSGTFFFLAILASYLPARRASRVDPIQSLRP